MTDYEAIASVTVDAPPTAVWVALTDSAQVANYMMDTELTTDWRVGSPISWKGGYDGNRYEDKGEVLEFEPEKRLKVTHFSPMSGQDDKPENYRTVLYELVPEGAGTTVTLTQGGNGSRDEAKRSGDTWQMMLDGLKNTVEEA